MRWVKLTAVLLAFSIAFCCLAGDSAALLLENPTLSTEISTIPTTEPVTEPVTEPSTEPPTEPITEPVTTPTEPSGTDVTEPSLTEPWASQEVTIGEEIAGITAKKAFVYDCETKSFLYMKSEADAKLYPASITKLFNVYTALKWVNKDTVITIDEGMLSLVPIDTSKAELYAGEQLTVENLIKGVLVCSGSDAAHILAVFTGRLISGNPELPAQEAENVFVEEMNRQVGALGLVNTHFVNCDGYTDYYHYTCMADLMVIANLCLNTPLIRDTVKNSKAYITFTNGKSRKVFTTNYLLYRTGGYYRKAARGLKTGTTEAAGACLLSAFWLEDHYMIIGVFGCPTFFSRYSDTTKLFDRFKS